MDIKFNNEKLINFVHVDLPTSYKYNRFLTSLILLLDSQFGFGSKRHKGKPTNLSQQTNFVDAIPDFNLVLLLLQGISRYNSTTEKKY